MAFNFTLTEEKPFHAGEIIDLDRQLTELYTSIEGFGSEVCRLDGVIDNVHTALEHLADPKLTDEKTVVALFNADHALEMLCDVTEDKLTAKMACEALDEQKKSNWEKFKNFCKQLWEKIKVFVRDLFSMVGENLKQVESAIEAHSIYFDIPGTYYDAKKLFSALADAAVLEQMAKDLFNCVKQMTVNGGKIQVSVANNIEKCVQLAEKNSKHGFVKYDADSHKIVLDKSVFERSKGTLADHGWTEGFVKDLCKYYRKFSTGHSVLVAMLGNMQTMVDRVEFDSPNVKLGFSLSSQSYSAMCSVMRAFYHAIGDVKRCIEYRK